ncbi:ABC-type dipeptide/oligopeptide/nickel transport system permease subunit [Lipingzhangella halophila]|uniref:ABC-type dipeptide/oligopeptide/nickel transport system permease subunit n=1 Tax=Lipingzhangella halophila TaxID=1783352 RepID=A0A7W7RMZ6_9ACTN|nr:ABC transporter permease [Lipingzhangella halophila]MBB4934960.1 ABC-type dipeptide/oligopeptide/nickel transport system permease subunit [Lipingzhangella halophila]
MTTTTPPPAVNTGQPNDDLDNTAPRTFWRRLVEKRAAMVSLVFLAALAVVAILARFIAPHDPAQINLYLVNAAPSADHLLGTDDLGRDVLSRLLHASQLSLMAPLQAVSIALVIGLPLGLASGYLGGRVDNVIMRVNDAIMAFPALILAVVIVGLLGPSLPNAMTAIGIVYGPRIMRVVRGSALSVREDVYVTAARAIGCSGLRTVLRHILPNILGPLVVQVTVLLGHSLLAEAALSFLGLGVQPPEASWGAMLGRSFPYLGVNPVPLIAAGVVISVTVLSLNLLGDGLRDSVGAERKEGR